MRTVLRRYRAVGGGLAAGVAAMALLVGAGPVSAGTQAAPPRVTVDPGSLPRGADPSVAYLVRDTIRDGRLRVPATTRGHHEDLWTVARGYVVNDRIGPRNVHRLVFVARSGSKHLIARVREPLGTAVSADGRRIAWGNALGRDPGPPSVVTVAHPRTGRVIATRHFHYATVLGVSRHRVLLNRMDATGHSTTWWWDYTRDHLSRLSPQRGLRADLVHRRVVLGTGGVDSFCIRVAPLDHPRRTLWRSCGRGPRSWSPDGTRELTTYNYFDDVGTPRWDVTRDRTGRLELRLNGRFDWHSAWEDNAHVLVIAQGDDGKAAIVRCSLRGRCVRASRIWALPKPDYLPNFIAPPVVLPAN